MALIAKGMDEATLAAIAAFDGRVKTKAVDRSKLRYITKMNSRGRGSVSKVTMGFNEKSLTDSGVRVRGVKIERKG